MIKQTFFYQYTNQYLPDIPRIVYELKKQGKHVLQIYARRIGRSNGR